MLVLVVVLLVLTAALGLVMAMLPLPRLHAVIPRSGNLPDAPGNVAGELGHEQHIAVTHDGDGPVGRGLVEAPDHLVGELHEVLGAPIDLVAGVSTTKKQERELNKSLYEKNPGRILTVYKLSAILISLSQNLRLPRPSSTPPFPGDIPAFSTACASGGTGLPLSVSFSSCFAARRMAKDRGCEDIKGRPTHWSDTSAR